jgi:hypothetical protein
MLIGERKRRDVIENERSVEIEGESPQSAGLFNN